MKLTAKEIIKAYRAFLEECADEYSDEIEFVEGFFFDVPDLDDLPDSESEEWAAEIIEDCFDSLQHINPESYREAYDYYYALHFFYQWRDSSELRAIWTDLDFIEGEGFDSPYDLWKAASDEYTELDSYEQHPLCDQVCEWNRYLIYEIASVLLYVWEEKKREA